MKNMINKAKIENAVKDIIEAIGENPQREGLIDTPKRVGQMIEEIMAGYNEDATQHLSKVFDAPQSDVVIEKDITFYSVCEHHLMPFFGKIHIAYVPNGKVVGLSKLARTVDVFAKRLQIQEQLTNQIADSIFENLNPLGVMVICEAEHTCMTMRGIKKTGSKTTSLSTRGNFVDNFNLINTVFQSIKL